MKRFPKLKEWILKIWKDPVWSKVISVIVLYLGTLVYQQITNQTWSDVFRPIPFFLTYKIPVYFFLSFIGVIFGLRWLLQFFKKKKDPFWDEKFGSFTFKELYNTLIITKVRVAAPNRPFPIVPPRTESLLKLYMEYYVPLTKEVDLYSNIGDDGFLYHFLAPAMVGYGLVEVYKKQDENVQNAADNAYKISEMGHKFHSYLKKVELNETMDKIKKGKLELQEA